MLFPPNCGPTTTSVELLAVGTELPVVLGTGLLGPDPSHAPLVENGPGMPLLAEQSRGRHGRPHLRGRRQGGRDWSTRFVSHGIRSTPEQLAADLVDHQAGLEVRLEMESVVGGALRVRYILTNVAAGDYLLDGLEVALPVADALTEVLDFTGRHEHERAPQRHTVTDGLWLRESRVGRPGLGSPTMVVLGTPGFSTTTGEVVGVHAAWSGNSVLRVEREAATGTTLGGGELLLPGEIVLGQGQSYGTPWIFFVAADDGLDGLAAVLHAYQRSLPSHPHHQRVLLNVWEAVYFDHDLTRLEAIADRAASAGIERFVLDDGWFTGRRDDTAGLGDWTVDATVWPQGLTPLVEHVRSLGMQFGLWFEPEMVNPDSDLFRTHPDWILATGGRTPLLQRHQQVLDLSRVEVWDHVFGQMSAILDAYPVDYVKWDHNRDLLDAGSATAGGAPVVHLQTLAFYRLLDALRKAHPDVAWESCASGGGRVDLGVLERVERVWTSDMTDALARQQIQRWTTQLLAPEYVGAHISSPTSHATGRTLTLDFRAATALFGSFGVEWDLGQATPDDLASLAGWVALHKRLRPLLHSGRVVRPESADASVQFHGVVAADRSEALLAHVQLEESSHNRGVWMRIPALDPEAHYAVRWEGPVVRTAVSKSAVLPESGPTDGAPVTGRALGSRGLWFPRRRPESVLLVHLTRT